MLQTILMWCIHLLHSSKLNALQLTLWNSVYLVLQGAHVLLDAAELVLERAYHRLGLSNCCGSCTQAATLDPVSAGCYQHGVSSLHGKLI